MRYWISLLLILISLNQVCGQTDTLNFFNEFTASLNRTLLNNDNTEDRLGFGLGIYHSFRTEKTISLTIGVEYNRTSQFKKYMYAGHFAHATDITYNLNSLSVPILGRLNIGNKTKFFVETGAFLDINMFAKSKGVLHTYLPNQSNQEFTFSGKADHTGLNYGFSLGIGLRIPIAKLELIIKPDYKIGFNSYLDYNEEIANRYVRLMIGIKI